MKKLKKSSIIIGVLLAFFVISACGTKPAGGDKPTATPTAAGSQHTIIQPSEAAEPVSPVEQAPRVTILETVVLDMANLVFADSPPEALIAHIGEHMAASTMQEADNMLLILETIQNAWLDYYLNRLELNPNIDPQTRQALYEEMTRNGFRQVEVNRRKIPVIDYSLYKKWEGMLSGWFKDYIAIIQTETESPAVMGGKLAIAKEELEKRLLRVSVYADQYPDSVRLNQVISLYDSYLYCYLYGFDRDAVINFETGRVSKEYYSRYLEFVKINPETTVSSIISGYAAVIEKGSFVLNAELEKYLEDVFSFLEDQRIVVRNDIGRQILMEHLSRLLPEQTSFTWKCLGPGSYQHSAVLAGIHTEDGNPVYILTGTVGNAPIAENPDENAAIELEYRIEDNVLYQMKSAPLMPDSDFNEIEVIRYPFVAGHSWYQYPEIEGINNSSIHTEIISVTQENGISVLEVEYSDPSTGQYEKRLLQSGKGTIAFTKLYSDGGGDPVETGYFIDEANTGYAQPQPVVP